MLGAGFVALSDDDYSRTVIAERFAAAPHFDPSGTSWLPLPFWVTGSVMMLLGRTFDTARIVAFVEGLAAATVVLAAARRLGASRGAVFLGAALAVSFPVAAALGVSTQPEALTAGLLVFGAATTTLDGSSRLAGAVALAAACLCRYEAWPAAATFAALCVLDAGRFARNGERAAAERSPLLAALVALAAPAWWMAHGALLHGSPLFFAHRVAAYRQALGEHESVVAALTAYPVVLVRTEAVLVLGTAIVAALGARADRRAFRSYARPALVLLAVLAFLAVGRVLDGAPTHHAERTLLPIWTAMCLFAADMGTRAFGAAGRVALSLFLVWIAVHLVQPAVAFADGTAKRAAERSIGEAARRILPTGDRLLVDTPDYGYFAVVAAFGAPERAEPFESHDPRLLPRPDPFVSPAALRSEVASRRARWIVVQDEHRAAAGALGAQTRAHAPGFSLVVLP